MNDDAVLNNPNVIRCMYFVKEILEEVKRNNGYIGKKVRKSDKQNFPLEVLSSFVYREDQSISRLVVQINEMIDQNVYQKLSYKPIVQWLKQNDFLMEELSQEFNKVCTLPTEKGSQLGITAEKRTSFKGVDFMLILYNRQAQEYIVKNMALILGSAQ